MKKIIVSLMFLATQANCQTKVGVSIGSLIPVSKNIDNMYASSAWGSNLSFGYQYKNSSFDLLFGLSDYAAQHKYFVSYSDNLGNNPSKKEYSIFYNATYLNIGCSYKFILLPSKTVSPYIATSFIYGTKQSQSSQYTSEKYVSNDNIETTSSITSFGNCLGVRFKATKHSFFNTDLGYTYNSNGIFKYKNNLLPFNSVSLSLSYNYLF